MGPEKLNVKNTPDKNLTPRKRLKLEREKLARAVRDEIREEVIRTGKTEDDIREERRIAYDLAEAQRRKRSLQQRSE